MVRQRRNGAGLDIGREAGLNTDAMLGKKIHQRAVFNRFYAMADTLGAQLADRLPDAFRTSRFTRMHRYAETGVARLRKVAEELAAGKAQLIARQIDGGDVIAVRQ